MRGRQCAYVYPQRMHALGVALGRVAAPGDRFLLEGPLGAGKTTFVQGLADGLDVHTPVSSPSFVIENQYRGRLVLYHVDLYRLERVEPELLESLEEHLYGDGVTAVDYGTRRMTFVRQRNSPADLAAIVARENKSANPATIEPRPGIDLPVRTTSSA